MPKEKKDLNKVKYVSIADFYRNVDDYKTLDGKIDYVTRCILSHGADPKHDYALSGLVSLARMKIAEIANRKPAALENNLKAQMFLGNPKDYIKGEADKLIKHIDEEEINTSYDDELKANAKAVKEGMNEEFNIDVFEVDKISKTIGVKSRVEAGFGGKKGLEDNLNATKGNWFSKLVGTSSKEWNKLEEAYQDFNNPHREAHGDLGKLSNAVEGYLKHKFPSWKLGEDIPEGALSKLNKSETAKVMFSVNVMNAVIGQNNIDKKFHSLVDECKEKDIKYSDIPEKENEVVDLDLDQSAFQNQLKRDTEVETNVIDDYLDESKEVNIEKEEEIDDLDTSIDSNHSI